MGNEQTNRGSSFAKGRAAARAEAARCLGPGAFQQLVERVEVIYAQVRSQIGLSPCQSCAGTPVRLHWVLSSLL